MTQSPDNYRTKKNEIYRLYIAGLEPGDIAGRTGVSAFRIQREMDIMTQRDPTLLSLHIKNKYPSQRKKIRWSHAKLVMSNRELTESRGEY